MHFTGDGLRACVCVCVRACMCVCGQAPVLVPLLDTHASRQSFPHSSPPGYHPTNHHDRPSLSVTAVMDTFAPSPLTWPRRPIAPLPHPHPSNLFAWCCVPRSYPSLPHPCEPPPTDSLPFVYAHYQTGLSRHAHTLGCVGLHSSTEV